MVFSIFWAVFYYYNLKVIEAMTVRVYALGSLTSSYMQRKRKSRKGGSLSTLSFLRRELREGNLQSLFGGSSCVVTSTNAAPDPLLSSFILPMADDFGSVQHRTSAETVSAKRSTSENVSERYDTVSYLLSFSWKSFLFLVASLVVSVSLPCFTEH